MRSHGGIRKRRRCGGWERKQSEEGQDRKERMEDRNEEEEGGSETALQSSLMFSWDQRPELIANEAIESAIRYSDVTVMDSVGGCSSRKAGDTRMRERRRTSAGILF